MSITGDFRILFGVFARMYNLQRHTFPLLFSKFGSLEHIRQPTWDLKTRELFQFYTSIWPHGIDSTP
ncbi:unnamed protein product [Allacma fusca]|uniref:Uncharacterized protein n=1 Tax=Allacma fusca TaxID=39272 RepID=A0A8J2JTC5_9HEXA|nr:unnamed protein product [Allacma fusca]